MTRTLTLVGQFTESVNPSLSSIVGEFAVGHFTCRSNLCRPNHTAPCKRPFRRNLLRFFLTPDATVGGRRPTRGCKTFVKKLQTRPFAQIKVLRCWTRTQKFWKNSLTKFSKIYKFNKIFWSFFGIQQNLMEFNEIVWYLMKLYDI